VTTGRIILTVLTFEVTSVSVPTNKITMINISTGGNSFKASPIFMASPETMLPFETAKPLPNRNINLHGIFV